MEHAVSHVNAVTPAFPPAPYAPVAWADDRLHLLDQTLLPHTVRVLAIDSIDAACEAIRTMRVRGAPAIGIAAAYALALAVPANAAVTAAHARAAVDAAAATLAATRPTAVNLRWALERVLSTVASSSAADAASLRAVVLAAARALHDEQIAADAAMARHGAALLEGAPPNAAVLHHCNTGPLATAGGGTALGVAIEAVRRGHIAEVLVDETRPRLQGARLTAWELDQHHIAHRVIADGAAATMLASGRVAAVLVGADRIAANGDTANKIGTYALAIAARYHAVPCYVVAPLSTFDAATADGAAIPIEERDGDEVLLIDGVRITPTGTRAANPAFDVTPAALVTAFVTERGVLRPPYPAAIATALHSAALHSAAVNEPAP